MTASPSLVFVDKLLEMVGVAVVEGVGGTTEIVFTCVVVGGAADVVVGGAVDLVSSGGADSVVGGATDGIGGLVVVTDEIVLTVVNGVGNESATGVGGAAETIA